MPLDADRLDPGCGPALLKAVPGGAGRAARRPPATAAALLRAIQRGPTATRALGRWCEQRGLGEGPVHASVLRDRPAMIAPDILLDALEVVGPTRLRHRRATLRRGEVALADCDLWWLPDRLPAAVTAALDATDQPFGALVAPLRPRRCSVETWIAGAGAAHVLEIGAVVLARRAGGPLPVAVVRERYRGALLG